MRASLGPLVILVGIILLVMGYGSFSAEFGAKPEPDAITAADLVAKGAPTNLHVRIVDAVPDQAGAVRLTTTSKRSGSSSVDAFVPLTTAPTRFGEKPALAAILAMSPDEAASFRGGPAQGMRLKSSLNSKVADRMAQTYGKEAVAKAPVVRYGRKPEGLGSAYAMLGLGVLAGAGGVFLMRSKKNVVPLPAPASFPPAPPPVPRA